MDGSAGSQDAHGPTDSAGADEWLLLGLNRLPDGSGYRSVGKQFSLTITSDLDVELEFDADPASAALEGSDLRVAFAALVVLVWRIALRFGSPSREVDEPDRPDCDTAHHESAGVLAEDEPP